MLYENCDPILPTVLERAGPARSSTYARQRVCPTAYALRQRLLQVSFLKQLIYSTVHVRQARGGM